MKTFLTGLGNWFGTRTAVHVAFCCLLLLFFLYSLSLPLSQNREAMAIFGFSIVICSVYAGRWLWKRRISGCKGLDFFRMSFLSFLFLSLAGLAAFVHFVEPDLRITHYPESFINVSLLTLFCLSFGFFVSKFRKSGLSNSSAKDSLVV